MGVAIEVTPFFMENDYTEYNELTDYQKRCLWSTNFWRVVYDRPTIAVPEENTVYWNVWNKYYADKSAALRVDRIAWLSRQ